MDVPSPALPAGKPSVAHTRAERRHSPLQRALAFILANALFWQPVLVQAQGVVAGATNTQVGQAGNGVPVVNIAAPNAAGVSHNQYQQYNVDAQGLILNNATGQAQATQLGGLVHGNPNLQGQAAGTILNEVTGANPSQLKGYTEVAGQAARVIVANPHGITCNGCGFINTPRATLSTGKPVLDAAGQVQRFNVQGGSVAIEGAGLNATNVEQFDIITRSAKINAQLHANKLNVIAGRNDVDAATLAATPLADDGSEKPELAIDSSALGGMYAGAVKLVGTEAGVGVKLAGDLAASGGDIQIDANGKLTLGQAAATGTISATARDIEVAAPVYAQEQVQLRADKTLVNRKSVAAGQAVTLQADQLSNSGIVEAGVNPDNTRNASGDVQVTARTVVNTGSLTASRELNASVGGALDNRGGKLLSQGNLKVAAGSLDNRGGQLLTDSQLTVSTDALDNAAGVLSAIQGITVQADALNNSGAGQITSGSTLNLDTGTLTNAGLLSGRAAVTVKAGHLDNRGGTLVGNAAVSLTLERLSNGAGQIVSGGDLLLGGQGQLDNRNGRLSSQGLLSVLASSLDNREQGVLTARRVSLGTDSLDNRGGTLYSEGSLYLRGARLDNRSGQIAGTGLDFGLTGALLNEQGVIESATGLTLAAASLDNRQGRISALGSSATTRLDIGGTLDNRNGQLQGATPDMTFALGRLLNGEGHILHAGTGTLGLSLALLQDAGGSLTSNGTLRLQGAQWNNSTRVQAALLDLDIGTLTLLGSGQLLADKSLTGRGQHWTNNGLIASDGDLNLALTGTYSGSGRLISLGKLGLSAARLTLADGSASIASAGNMTLDIDGILANSARITAGGHLRINAASLDNSGTLGAAGTLGIGTATLFNHGGLIFSGADMQLRVNDLTNQNADIYSLGDLQIAADAAGNLANSIVNRSGNLTSDGNLSLAAQTIHNVRDVLSVNDAGIYSARIDELACTTAGTGNLDCSGGKEHHVWAIEQLEKLEVTAASAASSITAGGNVTLRGSDFLNSSSTLASAGTLNAVFSHDFGNVGVLPSETRTRRTFVSERTRSPGGWYALAQAFNQHYSLGSPGYDASALGGLEAAMSTFIARTEREVGELRVIDHQPIGQQTYAAVIQAGGAVGIQAGNDFDNSAVQQGFTYVSGGPRTDTSAPGSAYATAIKLDSQLPPDLAQQQINPTTLPGFSLPTGQNGLFQLADATTGGAHLLAGSAAGQHPYLIETNPALTDLRQFLGSDYLIDQLAPQTGSTGSGSTPAGTGSTFIDNPDANWKRLGDGYYEQRLVSQAIVARTGQRYLNGLTSDEATFKYLMDNAIASRDALNLSLGVSLSGEQVAALTHDIVWMEQQQIQGQRVLVPVLYLAQADNHLAANGALIQGSDLSLIAGNTLSNVGTLLAGNNLGASAGNNLINSGLIQASERLALQADNNLLNQAGGVITGRDVSLTATHGSVSNERTVTSHQSATGASQWREDFADSAARVEAAGDLVARAGTDVNNIGGVLQATGSVRLEAGRDVNIVSAQTQEGRINGADHNRSSITQLPATVSAGQDIAVQAGNDINVIASQVKAQGNLALSASNDLTIASAASERHAYDKTRKVTAQEDHITQVASQLSAGGNVALEAGQNLTLSASEVKAGNDAYLYAGNALSLLAAQDYDYSLYDMKKKGSFGAKQTQRDEVTDLRHVGTRITTGSNLLLASGGGQHYQAAQLDSGRDLTLESGGAITFEGVKDLHQESHEKSKSDLAWNSMKGKGNTDETLRQTRMIAKGELAIRAVDGLQIDVRQVDEQTVGQAIDAMVKADPQLAWLKDAERRGDVDWRQVRELHDSFKYSHSGLGQGAMLAIVIIITVVTAGTGAFATAGAAAGGAANTAATAAGFTYTTAGAIGAAAETATIAGLTSLTSQAAISTINNKGNLGAVVKDTFSRDSLQNAAISGLAAGFTNGVIDRQLGGTTQPYNNLTKGFDLSTASGAGGFALHSGAQGLATGTIRTAIKGGSLADNLSSSLVDQAATFAAAVAFYQVGSFASKRLAEAGRRGDTLGKALWAEGGAGRTAMHALMGGAVSSATGGDFMSGAVAAGASQAMAGVLNDAFINHPEIREGAAKLVGLTAAGLAGGDVEKAAWVSGIADQYNRQLHVKESLALTELREKNPDNADRLNAAACAVVHCSASVPEGEARNALEKLEQAGAGYKDEIEQLFATGMFDEYSWWDSANDFALKHEEIATRAGKATEAVGEAVGAALGYTGAVASAPLCASVIGCTVPAASLGMGTYSAKESWEAAGQILAPYSGTQASDVINSFDIDTYPGDATPILDYGLSAASVAAELALAKVGGKLLLAESREGAALGNAVSADGNRINRTLETRSPCCFAAGTQVSTPDGDRAIETLKAGDIVWSKPEKGGKPFAAVITATHVRNDQPIYRLTLKGLNQAGLERRETLLVTPSHPFYVAARKDFIPVSELRPGDRLQSLADGETENTSSEVESLELYAPVGTTYNLTVDVGHTFYVGEFKTWVHNTGDCDPALRVEAESGGAKATGNTSGTLALPSPEFKVPTGYSLSRNADGSATVTGPRGGVYDSTGRYSAEGKPIYRDNSGGYVTLDGGRNTVSAPPNYESVPLHHICTNKCTAGANGQVAWTKEYQRFFDGAGLNINRATENLVAVPGHRGPHPEAYHQYVYGSLDQATRGLTPNTQSYNLAVTRTLERIKSEAVIVGSQVNKWLTGQ